MGGMTERPSHASAADMLAAPPSPTRAEWRRGWPIVLGATVGSGAGPALFQNLSSLFVPGLIADFGWSRAELAAATGLGFAGSITVPLLGRLVDRIGVRPAIAGCMILLGAAYVGLAGMSGSLWQYHLLVFCLAMTVPGTSALVYGKLIAARFVLQRGLALGIATSGLPITTLLLPVILGDIIATHGWRGGFLTLAALSTLVALPIALLAIRHADTGPTRPAPGDPVATQPVGGVTAAEARLDPRFWQVGLTGFFINLATIGFITQVVPFAIDRGVAAEDAALLLTAFGASQIVARLAIGLLIDRFPPRRVAASVALVSALGFLLLQAAHLSLTMLAAGVFLAGLMNGAENDLFPFFAARLFGLRAYGEIYGSLIVIALTGSAVGIVGFGALHDATDGDAAALAIAAISLVIAGLLYLRLRDRALPPPSSAAAAG